MLVVHKLCALGAIAACNMLLVRGAPPPHPHTP
eukprot:SAG11_NODE_34993_length_269_cov_0.547059_1_plen_32_part_10